MFYRSLVIGMALIGVFSVSLASAGDSTSSSQTNSANTYNASEGQANTNQQSTMPNVQYPGENSAQPGQETAVNPPAVNESTRRPNRDPEDTGAKPYYGAGEN